MKVLQILPALQQGGVEHCVLENAEYLVKAGHQSIVISAGGRLVKRLESLGSQHITLPIAAKRIQTFFQINALKEVIEREAPDVVHVHSRLQAWLCYFALKKVKSRQKIHYITNVHGFNSVNFYSKIMLSGDSVLLESEAVRQFIHKNYPKISHKKLTVVPLGVDTERFHAQVDNQKILEQFDRLNDELRGAKIVTIVGRITRIKGHHHFISLIQQLKKEFSNIKGLIVGDYDEHSRDYYKELLSQIKVAGLEKDILFYGNCDNMPALYTSVDLTVSLTTKPESYGRTVLESLACKTAVVGFNRGGVGENLVKFYPQGLVEVDKPSDFYRKVLNVLKDKNNRENIPEINETLQNAQMRLQKLYQLED